MWALRRQLQTTQMLSVPVFFLAQGTCLRLGTLHLTGPELEYPGDSAQGYSEQTSLAPGQSAG